mmetsp:Transcript_53373/g.155565  ORF Transcript_53373/g.155565 Transcript_53373/m.155565 type:complete len:496 (-) Transcript_53373:178-1665(-)
MAPNRAASSGGMSSGKPGLCLPPASPLSKSKSRGDRGGEAGRSVTCASCAGLPLNLSKCFSSAFIVPQEYPHLQPISLVGPVSLGGSRDPRAPPPPIRPLAAPKPPRPPRPPRPPSMSGGMPPSWPSSASKAAGSFGSMPPSIASSPARSPGPMPIGMPPRRLPRPPPFLPPLPPMPRPRPPRPPPRPPKAANSSRSKSPRSPNMPCCICSIMEASSSSSSLIWSILSRNLPRSLALSFRNFSASETVTPRTFAISLASGICSGTWRSSLAAASPAAEGPSASGAGALASFLYMSMTASASLALSTLLCMCDRMSGTPFTLDMSALLPSGITNVPVGSPMPVTCFMKDSKEAFILLIVSLAHSSHSNICFCSKCASINRLLEAVCSHMVHSSFFPFGLTLSSMNCASLSWSSVQGRTSCIMSSTMPPSSIISPTHMFMNWSMSKSSRSMSPDLSYLSRFFSSESTEKASAIFWNLGLASGSPKFLSGWYFKDRFL